MASTIKVDDLAKEIMKGLEEYADLATDKMKDAVKKAGNEVKSEISKTAPRNTGKYAKSWTVKTTKEFATSIEVTVHSKNRYRLAHLLEHGHAKRGGGRVSAQPHIAPAEEKGIQMLEKDIQKALGG